MGQARRASFRTGIASNCTPPPTSHHQLLPAIELRQAVRVSVALVQIVAEVARGEYKYRATKTITREMTTGRLAVAVQQRELTATSSHACSAAAFPSTLSASRIAYTSTRMHAMPFLMTCSLPRMP